MPQSMIVRSKVNQPDRVFINSSDDPNNATAAGFSQFTAIFQTPILAARRCQLLRATIPNALVNIPDYQLVFWYYSLASATATPSDTNLFCVRLYPSTWQIPSGTLGTNNRCITGGQDFVNLLNSAAQNDNTTNNPYWAATSGGDVIFSWNATYNQITFTGNNAGRYYCAAGYNDPLVIAAQQGKGVTVAAPITMQNAVGGGTTPQPYALGYTLNLRVGYAFSGQTLANQGTQGNPLYANLTNQAYLKGTTVPADSFPNLVYTGSVYLYSPIVSGSSLGSGI